MKKHDLLNLLNGELLDRLFLFCYARTCDSYEAQELCSDIIFEIVKSADSNGEIKNPYPFIWKIAKNVYADFSESKRRRTETFQISTEENYSSLSDAGDDGQDDQNELLDAVHRRIAFLTKAYREVMIMFYMDGLSTAEIAKRQHTSESAVRQRLFSARQKIRNEADKMTETYNKPIALDDINYVILGTGDPKWGDPRTVCYRKFSKHIVFLCSIKPSSASEIAKKLNVPTVYVEEELDILSKGENGKYGLLRKTDNGRYAINFILLSKEVMEKSHAVYKEQISKISGAIAEYIKEHKTDYLSFPYLNKRIDSNLVIWQQIYTLSEAFFKNVEKILSKEYFKNYKEPDRPFSVYGYVDYGKHYGCGWDIAEGQNVCGFKKIRLENIYITRIKRHFSCSHNIASDPFIQLALRAVEGLDIKNLSEAEKEHAAIAIKYGYIYRQGDMLYTKILVSKIEDNKKLFEISNGLSDGFFEKEAQTTAQKIYALFKKAIPEYLLNEWRLANSLANLPVLDSVVENLIQNKILIPPEDGVGAEGCWMSIAK